MKSTTKSMIGIIGILTVVLAVVFFSFQIIATHNHNESSIITRGLNWNLNCTNNICTYEGYLEPVNYLENNKWTPINRTVVSSTDELYDYEVIKGVYHIFFKEDPTTAETVKYKHQNGTFYFQPFTLNYRNALDMIQQINTIQDVTGYPIEHVWETEHIWYNMTDTFFYPDAFGYNTNMTYEYGNKLLKQKLFVNPSNLPEPEDYITNQENVTIDVDFLIDYPDNVDVYIDGILWDKHTTRRTQSKVDFKVDNEILFFLPIPRVCEKFHWGGDDGNKPIKRCVLAEYEFKKTGNKLYTILKAPYNFINNTNYLRPIEIDPSIEVSITQSSDDAGNNNVGYDDNDATYYLSTTDASAYSKCGWRFLGITIPQGATITAGEIEFRGWTVPGFGGSSKSAVHGIDEDNADTWAETTNEPKDATLTDAFDTGEWDAGDLSNGVHSPKRFDNITAIVQEIVNRGAWVSGNAMAFYTKDNGTGFGWSTSAHTYDHASFPAPKLTIVYADSIPPNVILVSPADNSTDMNGNITFQCNATDNIGVENISLYGNWSGWHLNQTINNSNIALNKNAYNSSQYSTYSPDNAVDGDYGTVWASADEEPSWIYVDLADNYTIDRVIIYWYSIYYATNYSIEVSDDASTWTNVINVTDGDGGADELNFASVTTRYVRMYGINKSSTYFSISEFEIYRCITPISFDVTDLSNGNYKWNCLAFDEAGNSGWGDANWTFTVEVVYNETLARQAILEGINNIIPNATIYTYLEIDIRYMNGSQANGFFDKVAFLYNQSWGFNYITGNESFTNMTSSYNVFNVWENSNLTYSQIIDQVENYINETLV